MPIDYCASSGNSNAIIFGYWIFFCWILLVIVSVKMIQFLFIFNDRQKNQQQQTNKQNKQKQTKYKNETPSKKRDYICSQKLKHKIQRLANDWEFPLMRVKYFIFIVLSTNGSCDPRIWKTALCKCKNVHFHVAAMNEWNIVVKSPPQQMEWLWFP